MYAMSLFLFVPDAKHRARTVSGGYSHSLHQQQQQQQHQQEGEEEGRRRTATTTTTTTTTRTTTRTRTTTTTKRDKQSADVLRRLELFLDTALASSTSNCHHLITARPDSQKSCVLVSRGLHV
ncbi:unnamed protein product, partial [Polarella glacialis]